MAKTPIFTGTVKKGKPIPDKIPDFYMHCGTLEGKPVEIIVRRKYGKKSNKQNKYYRGCVVKMIADYCGYTEEKTHGILQFKFFKYDDGKFSYIKSTRCEDWITVEWEEKMSEIRQWASEFLAMYIPKPNEVDMY